jgi:hypothetical protein
LDAIRVYLCPSVVELNQIKIRPNQSESNRIKPGIEYQTDSDWQNTQNSFQHPESSIRPSHIHWALCFRRDALMN